MYQSTSLLDATESLQSCFVLIRILIYHLMRQIVSTALNFFSFSERSVRKIYFWHILVVQSLRKQSPPIQTYNIIYNLRFDPNYAVFSHPNA